MACTIWYAMRSMPTNRKGYIRAFRAKMRKQGLCSVCCKSMDKPAGLCRDCTDRRNAYYRTDEGKEKRRVHRKGYRSRLRNAVLDGYGAFCKCCNEQDRRFLTLDHVNNDGNIERNGQHTCSHKQYTRLIEAGFPPHMQVYCYNCNMGKARNGGVCPHQDV